MKRLFLCALILSGCAAHVVKVPVIILPRTAQQTSAEIGLLGAIKRATNTNAMYPGKLKDRNLVVYKPAFSRTAKTEEEAQESGIAYLMVVGRSNAASRQKLQSSGKP